MKDKRKALQAYHLNKSFKDFSLQDVSIDLNYEEVHVIVGENGSGKSTLMNLIGCLDTPTDGYIHIDGELTMGMNEKELAYVRNEKVGFVFQQFNLLGKLNALDNVITPLLYSGIGVRERKELAKSALERVGLGNRMKHRPNELSGGQKQRFSR